MAGSVSRIPSVINAILSGHHTKKEISRRISYPPQQTKELLISLRKIGILDYKEKKWQVSDSIFSDTGLKDILEQIQFPEIAVSIKSVSKKIPVKIPVSLQQYLFTIDTGKILMNRPKNIDILDSLSAVTNAIMLDIIKKMNGIYLDTAKDSSGIFLDTGIYGVSEKIPLKSLKNNNLRGLVCGAEKSSYINTIVFILFKILNTIINIYFVNVIAKLKGISVNGNANEIWNLEISLKLTNNVKLSIEIENFFPVNGKEKSTLENRTKEDTTSTTNFSKVDTAADPPPKIPPPGNAKEKTLAAIRSRNRKRSEYAVDVREIIEYWNAQPNLRSHRKGTKTFKKIERNIEALLSGEWVKKFKIKNGLAGRVEILAKSKKKFLKHEIKSAIEQYNRYVTRISENMAAKSLDKFIYNEMTGGSWFFRIYIDGLDEPELVKLKTYLGKDDYDFVYQQVYDLLSYAGRRPPDEELAEILVSILPAHRVAREYAKKAKKYVKSLQLGELEQNFLNIVDYSFSFQKFFSSYLEKLIYESGNDQFAFGEKLNRWTFSKSAEEAERYFGTQYEKLRKSIAERLDYERSN